MLAGGWLAGWLAGDALNTTREVVKAEEAPWKEQDGTAEGSVDIAS